MRQKADISTILLLQSVNTSHSSHQHLRLKTQLRWLKTKIPRSITKTITRDSAIWLVSILTLQIVPKINYETLGKDHKLRKFLISVIHFTNRTNTDKQVCSIRLWQSICLESATSQKKVWSVELQIQLLKMEKHLMDPQVNKNEVHMNRDSLRSLLQWRTSFVMIVRVSTVKNSK